MEDKIDILKKWINECNKIVFFTGAGVSTGSGIPDFRGAHGLYKVLPEEIVSHHFFYEHTKEFYDFYWNKMVFLDALPNDAHIAMAELEKRGKCLGVITQNIDSLHQKAGSKNVIQLHGSIERNFCTKCNKYFSLDKLELNGIPYCSCGGIIKPDVVLYEEPLAYNDMESAEMMINNADMLIVCGTSLKVYPAANYISYFRGKHLVLINYDSTSYDEYADLCIYDKVEKVLKNCIL